jgi:DnaA family protein
MDLRPELGRLLIQRLSRDMGTLLAALNRLDRESLQRRRAVTVALARDVLGL